MNRKSVLLLLIAVGALLALGVVMLASTGEYAADARGRVYHFLHHQLVWIGVGITLGLAASFFDYHKLVDAWPWLMLISVILLALCLVPHIGVKVNGSSRWLRVGAFTLQPSELGKLAVICMLSWWYSREERVEKQFLKGFVVPLSLAGVVLALILCEVDVGCTALITATALVILIVAGSPLHFYGSLTALAMGLVVGAIFALPQRMDRFLSFMHPELYPKEAYQAQQGLIALGSGGLTGLGLGNGRQKLLYLPFAHTDFIFPMVGEELGLIGTLSVVFAYMVFTLAGVAISVKARDRAGLLLGMGLTMIISIQAMVNLGVTTELLPNKGLPLPFISYGGSNIVFCLVAVGILVNIYRQGVTEQEERQMEQLEMDLQNERRVVRL